MSQETKNKLMGLKAELQDITEKDADLLQEDIDALLDIMSAIDKATQWAM